MLLNVSRVPVIAAVLTAVGLLIHIIPRRAAAELQLDRAAVAAGEWWRLGTCHFTHWSANHLGWDVVAFLFLGAACELTSRRGTLVTLVGSILAIPIAVLAFQPQLQTYRGLSGLDSALFGLLAVGLLRQKIAAADRPSVAAIGLLIVGFLVKTVFETMTGTAMFADSAAGGFVPVPLAHLVGFITGALVALAPLRRAKGAGIHPHATPLRWPAL